MSQRSWKTYLDFVVKIEPAAGGRFRVEAQGPAGEAETTFTLPFDEKDITIFLLQVRQQRRSPSRGRIPEPMQHTVDFGGRLYDAVLSGGVRDLFVASRQSAAQKGQGLRLRLRLQNVPELADLPWEYLYDGRNFLALSNDLPLVHYLDLPDPPRPVKISLPLRILVTISAPRDDRFAALDVEQERRRIQAALGSLIADGRVELEFTPDSSLKTLQRVLRSARTLGKPYHVWHFIGHGGFDPASKGSILVLSDENRAPFLVNGFQLGTLFDSYPEIRLVLLNSCEGARASRSDPFSGVAAALVERSIPAVIGMQFEISDTAAIAFSEEFYAALVDGLPIDAALTEARRAVFFLPNWVEWATPILFMRSPNGVLFNIQTAPKADRPPAEKVEQERIAAEKAEQERQAAEARQLEAERAEQQRIAAEKAEQERLAALKAEQESKAALLAAQERQAAERAQQARIAAERVERERLAAVKAARSQPAAQPTSTGSAGPAVPRANRFLLITTGLIVIGIGIAVLVIFFTVLNNMRSRADQEASLHLAQTSQAALARSGVDETQAAFTTSAALAAEQTRSVQLPSTLTMEAAATKGVFGTAVATLMGTEPEWTNVSPTEAGAGGTAIIDDDFSGSLINNWTAWGSPAPRIESGVGDSWLDLKADVPSKAGVTSLQHLAVSNAPGTVIEFEAQLVPQYPWAVLQFDWDAGITERGPEYQTPGPIHMEIRGNELFLKASLTNQSCSVDLKTTKGHTYRFDFQEDRAVVLTVDGDPQLHCAITDMGLAPFWGMISFSGMGWVTRVKVVQHPQ